MFTIQIYLKYYNKKSFDCLWKKLNHTQEYFINNNFVIVFNVKITFVLSFIFFNIKILEANIEQFPVWQMSINFCG